MKHTRINVAVGHKLYKAICQFFAFHGYLEVEIATWLKDEATAQKCPRNKQPRNTSSRPNEEEFPFQYQFLQEFPNRAALARDSAAKER